MSAALLSAAAPVASTSCCSRRAPAPAAFAAAPRPHLARRRAAGGSRLAVAARAGHKVQLDLLDGSTHHLVVAEGENVLDAAIDAGLDEVVPYDCRMGVCLRCAAKVVRGRGGAGRAGLEGRALGRGLCTCGVGAGGGRHLCCFRLLPSWPGGAAGGTRCRALSCSKVPAEHMHSSGSAGQQASASPGWRAGRRHGP